MGLGAAGAVGIGAGISAGTAASVGAAGLAAAGSIGGALLSSSASGSAAKDQEASAAAAESQQAGQQAYTEGQDLPYIQAGDNAETRNQDLLDSYNDTVSPYLNDLSTLGNSATAQSALEQTPGYQFTLAQGLKSTQNAAAARGLGVSGAALKGAASYATGLADSTYQQQYSNALSNYNAANTAWSTQFGANNNLATLGANVAGNLGTSGQAAALNTSNLLTGAGNAAAAGTVGSANALSSGINGVSTAANNYNQNLLLQSYLNNNASQYGGFGNDSSQT